LTDGRLATTAANLTQIDSPLARKAAESISTSSGCATSNDVGFGLEVVAFRLVLAAERIAASDFARGRRARPKNCAARSRAAQPPPRREQGSRFEPGSALICLRNPADVHASDWSGAARQRVFLERMHERRARRRQTGRRR
jgi:hypothetical protein